MDSGGQPVSSSAVTNTPPEDPAPAATDGGLHSCGAGSQGSPLLLAVRL